MKMIFHRIVTGAVLLGLVLSALGTMGNVSPGKVETQYEACLRVCRAEVKTCEENRKACIEACKASNRAIFGSDLFGFGCGAVCPTCKTAADCAAKCDYLK